MSNAVKRLRCKKLVSQEELAKRLGVARQTISNYETGVSGLTLKQVSEILKALDATDSEMDEFFCEVKQDILSSK